MRLPNAFGAMQLSPHFSLNQLTVTDKDLPNIPDSEETTNLKELAQTLEYLYNNVGPFTVISAFRSSEVNDIVGGVDNSLHKEGKAADIQPTSMSAEQFYAKIISDNSLRNRLGEIALKNNVLHVSLPTLYKRGVAMIVENGKYVVYSVQDALKKIGINISQSGSTTIIYGVAAIMLAILAAYVIKSRRGYAD